MLVTDTVTSRRARAIPTRGTHPVARRRSSTTARAAARYPNDAVMAHATRSYRWCTKIAQSSSGRLRNRPAHLDVSSRPQDLRPRKKTEPSRCTRLIVKCSICRMRRVHGALSRGEPRCGKRCDATTFCHTACVTVILREQAQWALVVGVFPVLPFDDFEARHRTYGPAFGPSSQVAVLDESGEVQIMLAISGAFTDQQRQAADALRTAGRGWLRLTETHFNHPLLPSRPPQGTLLDVALHAPHGLLVAQGLIRLFGHYPSTADLTLTGTVEV